MSQERDYTRYSFRITFIVIAILLVITLIPPFSIGGVYIKRANILSDVIEFEDPDPEKTAVNSQLDEQFIAEAEKILEQDIPTEPPAAQGVEDWILGNQNGEQQTAHLYSQVPDSAYLNLDGVIPFEDFSQNGSLAALSAAIEPIASQRNFRIAFLGDSFIESDIITGDVREQLQELYSGRGVGFVPFTSSLAEHRPTVRHTFDGWSTYNLINKRSAPERYRESFFISGIVSVPTKTAWVRYRGTSFRNYISSAPSARMIFHSASDNTITITVNDTLKKEFNITGAEGIQQLRISGTPIGSMHISIPSPRDFIGYGVVFEAPRGVVVDNYSVRSNSGLALFGTNATVNRQAGSAIGGYDLIVLQYGLNAMEPNATNYSNYGVQLRKVINYIKSCFPGSTVILMGVGDRSTQRAGQMQTMPAVQAMIAEQRQAAMDCEVAFWNTYQAMGGYNGMVNYVRKGWAAKDYTHLSYSGGKQIAREFVKALLHAKYVNPGEGTSAYEFIPGNLMPEEMWNIGTDTLPQAEEETPRDTTGEAEPHFPIPSTPEESPDAESSHGDDSRDGVTDNLQEDSPATDTTQTGGQEPYPLEVRDGSSPDSDLPDSPQSDSLHNREETQ